MESCLLALALGGERWVEIKEGQVGLVAKRTVVYSEGEKGVNCLCQGYLVSPHSKTVLLGNLKI